MAFQDNEDKAATVTAEGSLLTTVRNLWGYMWPEGRPDLKLRVVLAIAALLVSKAATTFIPFAYKGIIDGLSQAEVARQMGVSINMVERHIMRGMDACRACRDRLDGVVPLRPANGQSPVS